jgi:hypothetical protein
MPKKGAQGEGSFIGGSSGIRVGTINPVLSRISALNQ